MHSSSNGSQPPSQKNEIDREHRITVIEMHAEQHQKSIDQHHERISYLERAVQGLIYATAFLATIKSDTIVEAMLKAAAK
jgi:hypothetical protein